MVAVTMWKRWRLTCYVGIAGLITGCAHQAVPGNYREVDHLTSTFAGTAVRKGDTIYISTRKAPVHSRDWRGNWVLHQPARQTFAVDVQDLPPESALAKVSTQWRTIPSNPFVPLVEPVTEVGPEPPVVRLRNWLQAE